MTIQPTIETPFGTDNLPYEAIGGEAGVRNLVESFYDLLSADPLLSAMHQKDLTEMRQKLFEFLTGWLGGPQLYIEKHGHPRLRIRHNPFPIDQDAVEAWLSCMDSAMREQKIDEPLYSFLTRQFSHTANFMRNM